MPDIDFSTPILDGKGEQVQNLDLGEPMTLASMVAACCFNSVRGDEALAPEKKAAAGMLAIRLMGGGVHALTAEQVTMLKDRIGRAYSPGMVARGWLILDPPSAEVTAK